VIDKKVFIEVVQFRKEKPPQGSYAPIPVLKQYTAETDADNEVLTKDDLSSEGVIVLRRLTCGSS
jgi:hypothetical protein